MNRIAIFGIVIALVAIGTVLASPLFYDTRVDEELPVAQFVIDGMTLEEFGNMDEQARSAMVGEMSPEKKLAIRAAAASTTVVMTEEQPDSNPVDMGAGQFVGLAGHTAKGTAKILNVAGTQFLRFEGDFHVTNGPDLRVYMTKDGDIGQGIHIGKLKGNLGSQNYELEGIDVAVYDTVVVYCQPFGVYFAKATLDDM